MSKKILKTLLCGIAALSATSCSSNSSKVNNLPSLKLACF